MRYIAMLKKPVEIVGLGLTHAEMREKLTNALATFKKCVETNFPGVSVLDEAWINTTVLLEIQDENLIPEIERVCDCKLKKNEKLRME